MAFGFWVARAFAFGLVTARTKPRRLKPALLEYGTNRAIFCFPYVRDRRRLDEPWAMPPAPYGRTCVECARRLLRSSFPRLAASARGCWILVAGYLSATHAWQPFGKVCPGRFANSAAGRSYLWLSPKRNPRRAATFAAAAFTPSISLAVSVLTRLGCLGQFCC